MNGSFVHLHNHSDRSQLDGYQSPRSMAATAAKLGQKAIGITDHGNLYAAYAFQAACAQNEVTPIIGIEAYVAPESRKSKDRILWGTPEQSRDDVSARGSYTHLSLWARNADGLRNLYALTSDSFTEGKLGKYPRMDREVIAEYATGLIASTGCPGGEVQTRLRLGQFDEAIKAAAAYQDIFGEYYFLELMDHGIEVERRVREGLLEIGRKLGIRPLVTNDSHYSEAHHADAHDVLLCIGTQAKVSEAERFRFDGTGYYLKSAEEMYGIDSSKAWQDGCSNTLLVAEMAEGYGDLFERRDLMPHFSCPKGHTEETLLRTLANVGLKMRGLEKDQRYVDRLHFELGVINQMGFPGYFLIVGDAISWARRNSIEVGPGRGSAAASLVCWVLAITAVDPLKHDLVFERFLNPERVSMPDIDIDFEDPGSVMEYLEEKYGAAQTARISTVMALQPRNALKDTARALEFPYAVSDMLSKAMPKDVFGKSAPLAALRDKDQPRYGDMGKLRELAGKPEYAPVIAMAERLEGTVRQTGMHAAGFVVSRRPLVQDVPLASNKGTALTQYGMNEVESLGLLKIDCLGLITLGTLRRALEATGVDRDTIPDDDAATWALLTSGHTTGVFQLEKMGAQKVLRQIKPSNLDALAAAVALNRPGPAASIPAYAARKNGRAPVKPIHPELKSILEKSLGSTFHLMVFQEQVMQAARDVCGWSLGKADLLRRAMGKKDHAKLAILEPEFFADGMEQGYSQEAMKALWDAMAPFADYGFNSAHAVAYASTGYLAAYLKAHYPVEYMAAHLESAYARKGGEEDEDPYPLALAEVRRMKIKLLPPSIDMAFSGFRAEDGAIRYGLDMIKGIGTAAVEDIAAGAPYESLLDYMVRSGNGKNTRVVKALASAGAMPNLGTRKGIIESAPRMAKRIGQVSKYKRKDNSLTEENIAVPVGTDEFDKALMLDLEHEYLGTYISAHPLDPYRDAMEEYSAVPLGDIETLEHGTKVTAVGMVVTATERMTKTNKPFGVVKITDGTGDIRFNVWSFSRDRGTVTWNKVKDLLSDGRVIKIVGTWDADGQFPGLEVRSVDCIDENPPVEKKAAPAKPDGLQLALFAAERGLKVFPVRSEDRVFVGQGGQIIHLAAKTPALKKAHPYDPALQKSCKAACGRPGHGLYDGTASSVEASKLFSGVQTSAYGIACVGDLVVVDLDVKEDLDGIASWEKFLADHGIALPSTLSVRTPSGGRHLYFKAELPIKNSKSTIVPGVDIRAGGGYVVGPGSWASYTKRDGSKVEGFYTAETPAVFAVMPMALQELLHTMELQIAS